MAAAAVHRRSIRRQKPSGSSGKKKIAAEILQESGSTTLFLLKWLTLAFLLESLMIAYFSADQIATVLGQGNAWAIPLATIVGVPAPSKRLRGLAACRGLSNLVQPRCRHGVPHFRRRDEHSGSDCRLCAGPQAAVVWYIILSLSGVFWPVCCSSSVAG